MEQVEYFQFFCLTKTSKYGKGNQPIKKGVHNLIMLCKRGYLIIDKYSMKLVENHKLKLYQDELKKIVDLVRMQNK